MKYAHKFSFQFDPDLLLLDLKKVVVNWEAHFNTSYYRGDWSGIPLREPKNKNHGLSAGSSSDKIYQNTEVLKGLSCMTSVMEYFKCEKTSVRLLKLAAGSEIKAHKDQDLTFFDGDVRLHVPIQTNEQVQFVVDNEQLEMKPGDCWFADFSKSHYVKNDGSSDRIHLVIDLKVNDWLRQLFEKEGILNPGEEKPSQINGYSDQTKMEVIKALLAIGSDAARDEAKKIAKEFNLDFHASDI